MNFDLRHFEKVLCPLGCPPGEEKMLVGRDRIRGLPGEFPVVRCCTCGLLRTSPRPRQEAMGDYYPNDYGPYDSTRVSPGRTSKHSWWKTLLKRIFEFNAQRLPPLPLGNMLEIGCASGAFLSRQQELGWRVAGIEFSEVAAANARKAGFDVRTGALEDASEPDEKFDLIVGWMVLEHLHDPVGSLKKLRNWTNRGGWLVLSLPDASPRWFSWFRDANYDLHLPNHLYHFTPQTLEKMVSLGGWHLDRVFHHRLLSSLLGSLGNKMEDSGLAGAPVRWLKTFPDRATHLHYLFYPLAIVLAALGQTGRMTVWARRVDD